MALPITDLCSVRSLRSHITPALLVLGFSAWAQEDVIVPDQTNDTLATPVLVDSVGVAGEVSDPMLIGTTPDLPDAAPLRARDTLDWRQRHSPKRAMLYSAVLPGAGQIYNRKYWKAPIVWAGLGVSVAFIQENGRQYRRYRDAYLAITDDDPNTVDEFGGIYTPQALLEVSDTYRRWRELSYIALTAVYILNILDATVDGYFVRFDVSDDLSMGMAPAIDVGPFGSSLGMSFSLALR